MRLRTHIAIAAALLAVGTTRLPAQTSWNLIGPHAGDVRCIATNAGGQMLIGGDGIFLSTDSAAHWTPTTIQLRQPVQPCETYDQVRSIVRTASGTLIAGVSWFHGAFRSTNNGATWAPSHPSPTPTEASLLFVAASGSVFTGTGIGLFRSTDQGQNWSRANFTAATVYDMAVLTTGHVFAATDYGLYRTTDQGFTWTQLRDGMFRSVAASAAGRVYGGTGTCDAGVLRWTAFGNVGGSGTQVLTNLVDAIVSCIGLSASGTVYADHYQLTKRSGDHGATWMREQNGLPATGTKSMKVDGSGNAYVGFHKGGVYRAALPVPVALSTFTAEATGPDVQLAWTTETERNNRGFDVQRRHTSTGSYVIVVETPGTRLSRILAVTR